MTGNPERKAKKFKITGKARLADLIERHPKLAQILKKEYGLHCVGCLAAAFDTLEEGAKIHGMSRGEIKKMIAHLNNLIEK